MTRDEVFAMVKRATLEVLPDLAPDAVQIDRSLKDLGANSLDRADIVTQAMAELGIRVSATRLASAQNLRQLVDILVESAR
jgi:polyketide biosynthesis acyl carrier protein